MYRLCVLFPIAFGVLVSSGCGSARIKELTAEVESLKAQAAQAEAEKARLETELADAQKSQQQIAAIKKGYEDARQQFAAQMKSLAPLLGDVGSPLPPFEGLADSSWVGKLAPGAKLAPNAKELENVLKGLLGDQGAKPSP
ncbi:MAG: hypothetical protein GX575_30420 [Candidatus Anammoximicrobium sp.]|nr:hypothetical protein [Candidatus Anammoximicrobium sp.]